MASVALPETFVPRLRGDGWWLLLVVEDGLNSSFMSQHGLNKPEHWLFHVISNSFEQCFKMVWRELPPRWLPSSVRRFGDIGLVLESEIAKHQRWPDFQDRKASCQQFMLELCFSKVWDMNE